MNEQDSSFWKKVKQTELSRRGLIRGVAGTVAGASLLTPKLVLADEGENSENASCAIANPISRWCYSLQAFWSCGPP